MHASRFGGEVFASEGKRAVCQALAVPCSHGAVALKGVVLRRLDDLPAAVVAATRAHAMHDFGGAAVRALHQLRLIEAIVVIGPPLAGARF